MDADSTPKRQKSGQHADNVSIAPLRAYRGACRRGESQADHTGGMEDASRPFTRMIGKYFGHQGSADGPLASNAHCDEETQCSHMPEFVCEVSQAW
jgi:hypothetical protein